MLAGSPGNFPDMSDFVLINFFASWCSHCQVFSPAWNEMAIEVNGDGGDKKPTVFKDRENRDREVRLIKMNCVDFHSVCQEKGIDAFPTLRLYKADGSFSLFEGKRDKQEIIRWIERTVKMKSYGWATTHEAFERGCNAKGHINVPRVPGHLEVMAGGGEQNLNPNMTNVSHLIKHFSFSDPGDGKEHRKSWSALPRELMNHVSPVDGRSYATQKFHEAWIHDFKVVSSVSPRGSTAYQFTHQHRLSRIDDDAVPQAQFHFDIEPFSILITREDKRWYDFATSVLAITGGIFAVMRLASSASIGVVAMMKQTSARSRQDGRSTLDFGHLD